MGEIWELVDINENKTGVLIERGTHTPIPEGMYHTAVDIWVKNESEKILLTQRHPDKDWGMKWECSGGALVQGETVLEGAKRELAEETGIIINDEQIKYLGKSILNEYQCIMYTFLACVHDDVKLELQEEEVVDSKWISICEMENLKGEIVPNLWERWLQFKSDLTMYYHQGTDCK